MERITLRSGEDIKAFIEAQEEARQQACAVFIASRAALRISPYAIKYFEFNGLAIKWDLVSKFIWRSLITSGVASNMLNSDVKSSATIAAKTCVEFTDNAHFIADKSAVIASGMAAAAAAAAAVDFSTPSVAASYSSNIISIAIQAEVANDGILWLEHADQGDGTLAITIAPLWSYENPLEQYWHDLRQKLRDADTPDERGADWSFWIKWYDDILAGNPQNWDMLHEIATTAAIDWVASTREVNDTINQIVERYRLRDKVVALRREVEQLRNATQYPPRNHNNPPELVADAPEVQEQLTIIWAAAREAEEELEKPKPDPTILSKAGQIILDFGIWFAKYCGKKVDLVINTTVTTAIKWGVPAAGAVYLTNPQKIIELGDAIRAAAGF